MSSGYGQCSSKSIKVRSWPRVGRLVALKGGGGVEGCQNVVVDQTNDDNGAYWLGGIPANSEEQKAA